MSGIGLPYKRFIPDEPYDTIVIGSGIGGMTTAAMLAKHAGQKVLVLEQHYTAGGYTHVFRRKGFEWDVGLHYVGEVGHPQSPARVVLDDICDEPIEWASMGDVYDRIVLGDEVYELPAGRQRFVEQLESYFPGEKKAIDTYVGLVRQARNAARTFFAERAVPAPVSALVGRFMRRNFEKLARRTTREVLEELTSNQKLIAVLTGQWGDYGLPPGRSSFVIQAMVAGHYFEGGYYPVGGSGRFAETIVPTIEKAGGQVVVCADVQAILTHVGRAIGVKMADGREIRAKRVVSNAGVHNTFYKLLPGASSARTERLKRLKPSVGHLCLYLGLDETAAELGMPSANYWLYRDEDHEKNLDAFVADPEAPLPVVYISFPAAKDPSFDERFPGRSTIDIITMGNYGWFEKWVGTRWHHRGDEYEAFKQRLTERMLEPLYQWLPSAKGHVVHRELSTPLTTKHFAAWGKGELYGLDHDRPRFAERGLRPRTEVKNLFLTGQDVCSAGIAGAMFGGVLCASAMLNKNMTRVARRSLGR